MAINQNTPTSLPQFFLSKIQEMFARKNNVFIPDHRLSIADVGDTIITFNKIALLKQDGRDVDNFVIFDPTQGVWIHDIDIFTALINVVKTYTSKTQVNTIVSSLAANARLNDLFITPYSGSRYLLFRNGCLDVKSMQLKPLSSTLVSSLYFTTRNRIEIDYIDNPVNPHFNHGLTHCTGAWTPSGFIDAYSNNDEDRLLMLLFGLSLGLFGGHNFGAHFDIQGESRWGKTTLSQIFQNIYPGRVMMIPWSSLNSQFAFTSYRIDKSIIWINECNMDSAPLDDVCGTVAYDGLADNPARFQVKGKDDLVINNPPQVYIDGTQLVQANENSNGPAGRTIPFELPKMTSALAAQSRATDIKHFLSDQRTLQWLVYNMIESYRKIIPTDQIDNYVISKADDPALIKYFPDDYVDWRQDMLTSRDEIYETFVDLVKPCLTDTTDPNDKHITIMHHSILYIFYRQHHRQINNIGFGKPDRYLMSTRRFASKIDRLFDQFGYVTENVGTAYDDHIQLRKRIMNISGTNFNFNKYYIDNGVPDELEDNHHLPFPFKMLVPGWFKIYKKK